MAILADFAVVADAVTTPLQAISPRRGRRRGSGDRGRHRRDRQLCPSKITAAAGATVIAVDLDPAREPLKGRGAAAVIAADGLSAREVRSRVQDLAASLGAPAPVGRSSSAPGTPPARETAFAMLVTAATLAVVGFAREKIKRSGCRI